MATQLRVFVPLGTAEYARLWGVSQRTARRRLAKLPGATKIGTQWRAPIYATEYAKRRGISVKTARKKGIRAATPQDALDVISHEASKKLRDRAYDHLNRIASKNPRYTAKTVEERIKHADTAQLRAIVKLTQSDWAEIVADAEWMHSLDWLGDDGLSLLYYH